MDIYGTLGPACADPDILTEMLLLGMTGVRLNLSHMTLKAAAPWLTALREAALRTDARPKLLIDMQGPELRIGRLSEPLHLCAENASGGRELIIPVPPAIMPYLGCGREILLDDGRILLRVSDNEAKGPVPTGEPCAENAPDSGVYLEADGRRVPVRVLRGGMLTGQKSIALRGIDVPAPAMTGEDLENIRSAKRFGVTGVMQPFVRSADDLKTVRRALNEAGCQDVKLLAKIENMAGVNNLESFFDSCDELVIARGDLGNAMPLWELPRVQKDIAARCRAAGKPFMVVTQMLDSMTHRAVPTRAEVSDIYNAVLDGASSVMVTGETAAGEYPAEVIRYLSNTVRTALSAHLQCADSAQNCV